MDVAGGTNDSFIRHALEPVFRWLGPALTSFAGIGGALYSSAYGRRTAVQACPGRMASQRRRALRRWGEGLPPWDAQTRFRVQRAVLDRRAVTHRAVLPPRGPAPQGNHRVRPGVETRTHCRTAYSPRPANGLAALSACPASRAQAELISIAATAPRPCAGPVATLQTWITLHNTGLPHSAVFGDDPGELLGGFPFAAVADSGPELVRQAQAIAAARYGISVLI